MEVPYLRRTFLTLVYKQQAKLLKRLVLFFDGDGDIHLKCVEE